jgi:hypothetical protein
MPIAQQLGLSPAAVSHVLRRLNLNRIRHVEPQAPPNVMSARLRATCCIWISRHGSDQACLVDAPMNSRLSTSAIKQSWTSHSLYRALARRKVVLDRRDGCG